MKVTMFTVALLVSFLSLVSAFVPTTRVSSLNGKTGVAFETVSDIALSVAECVTFFGNQAIAEKGSFSLCIPGGSIVKACGAISKDALDWSKVHIFFANEGLNDFKCYNGAMESFVGKVGIPENPVYKVGEGEPQQAAEAYAKLIMSSAPVVTKGKNLMKPIPSFDLILFGTGEDGTSM